MGTAAVMLSFSADFAQDPGARVQGEGCSPSGVDGVTAVFPPFLKWNFSLFCLCQTGVTGDIRLPAPG